MDIIGAIVWLICGFVAGVVAEYNGRNGCGWFLLGFLLGPFALLLAVAMGKDRDALNQKMVESGKLVKCGSCAELVLPEATRCRFCGATLERR